MKKIGIFVVTVLTLFVFTMSASAGVIDDKCTKCHKGEKAVDKVAAKNALTSSDALLKAVRGGSKAALHKSIADEDLKAAGDELFKKGTPAAAKPKKKAAEGC